MRRGIQLVLAITATIIGLGGFAGAAQASATGSYTYMTPLVQQGTGEVVGSAPVKLTFAASARSLSQCANLKFCLWTSSGYTGSRAETDPLAYHACLNYGPIFDKNGSSSYNSLGGFYFTLWDSYNGTGTHALTHNPFQAFSTYVGVFGWGDNIVSSVCGGDY